MIKFKWYRWVRCLFRARSFVRINEFGEEKHVLILADDGGKIENVVRVMHYEEEWPRDRDGPSHHPLSRHGI